MASSMQIILVDFWLKGITCVRSRLIVLFLGLLFIPTFAKSNNSLAVILDNGMNVVAKDTLETGQLIVITTEGWSSTQGKVWCFEKIDQEWVLISKGSVVVGLKGMGMGIGIRAFETAGVPQKKEGDLKAPAGIFRLGPAFGYAPAEEARWLKISYVQCDRNLLCIDDGLSSKYNKLVDASKNKPDWTSREEMRRKDDLYRWGLFVEHNADDPKQGKGSCIFLHIWKNSTSGTAGCSAMPEEYLLKILKWIDSKKRPLLIQFPLAEYNRLSKVMDLPEL